MVQKTKIYTKIIQILLIATILSSALVANDTWYKFVDEKKKLISYRDKNHRVKLNLKVSLFIQSVYPLKFDTILMAGDYYMNKSGHKFGRGKVYWTSEGIPACESEGYIKFRDDNALVGIYDKKGKIVVSADYNYISDVHNNLLYGRKYADRIKIDNEHYRFKGGTVYLLNVNNEMLVENFNPNSDIDYDSFQLLKKPSPDKIRDNLLGVNGKYYSFVNYQKEFKKWFLDTFLKQQNRQNISFYLNETLLFDNISNHHQNSKDLNKKKFISELYEHFNDIFKRLNKIGTEWKISKESYYYHIDQYEKLNYVFNSCGDEITEKYPLFTVYVNYTIKKTKYQDSISFLRTKEGYKIVHVGISDRVLVSWV